MGSETRKYEGIAADKQIKVCFYRCDQGRVFPESQNMLEEWRQSGWPSWLAWFSHFFQPYESVDYFEYPKVQKRRRQINAGRNTFVVSSVNRRDKYSEGYKVCTGLIVVGTHKRTGKEVSFLTHQNPKYLFDAPVHQHLFKEALKKRLEEMKKICVQSSIDAVFFGGTPDDYKRGKDLVFNIVAEALHFEPREVGGPKNALSDQNSEDIVCFATKKRQLFLFRADSAFPD